MKKMILSVAMGALVFAGCATVENAGTGKICPRKAKCTRTCAKAKAKCPFVGKWEFFVEQDNKLVALPVAPQPQLELCPKGVMRFHYAKEGKKAVLEGKWKVKDNVLTISNLDASNVQRYTLTSYDTAVFVVGANDRLPENTKVVISKVK